MKFGWRRGEAPAQDICSSLLLLTLSSFVISSAVTGCGGGSWIKRDGEYQLPKDLPPEIQDKFEVKDEAPPSQPSVAAPAAVVPAIATQPGSKKSLKKVAIDKKATQGPAFVYPVRRPEKDPIWIGEKHVFEITYFGMAAGDFTLEVLPHKAINARKVYHAKGTAVSSNVFSMFYRVNDSIETFFDYEGLFSHRFHLQQDETKQTRDSIELNDSEKGQSFFWNKWNHKVKGYIEVKDFFPMPAFSQDSLSALYYIRTLPLVTGTVVTFPVISEGKSWDAVVTVVRRETVSTPSGPMQAIVLKPEAKYQGILKKRGDSFLWLTDDHRRALIRLEAKVKIGTVLASLKKFEPGNPPEEKK